MELIVYIVIGVLIVLWVIAFFGIGLWAIKGIEEIAEQLKGGGK